MAEELFFKTIAEAGAMLAARQVSAVELTRAVIDRTRSVEPRVKAFNSSDEAAALAAAQESDARRAAGQASEASRIWVPGFNLPGN